MDYEEYEDEEFVEVPEKEKIDDKVENDELEANEAAFIRGYEEDEDKSFEEGEEDEEQSKEKDKAEK